MNPNLELAIIQFIANEYKIPPDQLSADTDFYQDLGLNHDKLGLLLEKLQEALNFILPETNDNSITTIGSLFQLLTPEDETDPAN